ncbi:hypothetical protein [Chryseosolibacter indicus]|uniref:Uncharacterized protein n=1 Tax=Chryseosolibacter indicus TaxID=2782351 RepID=A0ABS5VT67_9BACT|nr:hypothetical protein [Chryseosolibacter indicus]MBT1704625.1 hypothetical protein [Chryseosolibacter indicus]
MAHVRENDLTEGLSGKFGRKFVFKQLRGKTIVARRAKPTTKESALQRENRDRFKKASAYAKAMMLIAEKKAYYWNMAKELNLPNAYTAALSDYMRKPTIEEVDVVTEDSSLAIKVSATKKDFRIKMIKVVALGQDDVIVEEGDTVKDIQRWHYVFTTQKDMISKIKVVVQDEAGNVLSREIMDVIADGCL